MILIPYFCPMTKEEKIKAFDPNGAALTDSNIYGLPFTPEEADVVLVPVPWEVTVSYGSGASGGPEHIMEASYQVDLFHPEFPNLWKKGIAMIEVPEDLANLSYVMKEKAQEIIAMYEDGVDVETDTEAQKMQAEINAACETMNQWVEATCTYWMEQGKKVGLVGGDHSTPLGYFRAQAKRHASFGILHIDAHMDFRIAFEGFTYSHASIMYNALQLPQVSRIVQVGIRDFCEQENDVATGQGGRVFVHTNTAMRRSQFEGATWKDICDQIVEQLPDKVHISFDIDGLDPTLCPNTGTPVPGGLWFDEATYLMHKLKQSGKEIIGFDLVEVSPGEDDWNGNVGARMLFYMCGVLVGQ
jgi:agmatinase